MWRLTAALLTSALLAPASMPAFRDGDGLRPPREAFLLPVDLIRNLGRVEGPVSGWRFDSAFPAAAPTPRTHKGTRVAIVLTAVGAATFIWLYTLFLSMLVAQHSEALTKSCLSHRRHRNF